MLKKKIMQGLALILTSCTLCGYTVFAENEHTLHYDFDGGEAVGEYTTTATFFDEVDTPEATKEHYVLQGYDNGKEVIASKITHLISDISLKAVWVPEVYEVDFYDGENQVSTTNYAYGSETELGKFAEAIKEKHPYEDFKGWDVDGEVKTKLVNTDSGDKKAVAKFEGKTYNVAYENNGGTSENASSYKYGEGLELQNAVQDGYTFDGWFSDESCTNKVGSIDKTAHSDMTLYAGWTKIVVQSVSSRSSNGSSSSGSCSGSGSSSNSSGNWDYSTGMHVPSLGYHSSKVSPGMAYEDTDTAGYDTYNYEYWAYDSDGSFYKDDLVSGEDTTGFHRTSTRLYEFYDHASQGLSGAGKKMHAGDEVWFDGAKYTYSGNYIISTDVFNSFDFFEYMVRNGYRAVLRTCVEDNSSNYVLYLY